MHLVSYRSIVRLRKSIFIYSNTMFKEAFDKQQKNSATSRSSSSSSTIIPLDDVFKPISPNPARPQPRSFSSLYNNKNNNTRSVSTSAQAKDRQTKSNTSSSNSRNAFPVWEMSEDAFSSEIRPRPASSLLWSSTKSNMTAADMFDDDIDEAFLDGLSDEFQYDDYSDVEKQDKKQQTASISTSTSTDDSKEDTMPTLEHKVFDLTQSPPPIPWSSSPATHKTDSLQSLASARGPSAERSSSVKRELPWKSAPSSRRKSSSKEPVAHKKVRVATNDSKKKEVVGNKKEEKEKKKAAPKIYLSDEQKAILHMATVERRSIFFTGSAGTGKSVLLRAIIAQLKRMYAADEVAVTASTGLAACNIGGCTLHSFAGIGLGNQSTDLLVKKIQKSKKSKNRWVKTKVLIIDEISMVDGDLFDKLDEIARKVRKKPGLPFGGIQVVITGDFFQLPPVGSDNRQAKFAFEAKKWAPCIPVTIALTKVFRQKDDKFVNILNEMRVGNLSNESTQAFQRLTRPLSFNDGLIPTELFPTRREVELANGTRMRNLRGLTETFTATDTGRGIPDDMRNKLLSNLMAPSTLDLRLNAQVMLIKNIDDGLVNGSLGKVMGFTDARTFRTYKSICEDADFRDITREDLWQDLDDMDVTYNKLDKYSPRFRRRIEELYSERAGETTVLNKLPCVRFTSPDGTTRDVQIKYETWEVEGPDGEILASRTQVPLILAWALSIHKAQGQTMERVKVDLGRVFEKGQAYVALSRATSMEGLEIARFNKSKIMAHPKVVEFYRSLANAQEINGSSSFLVSNNQMREKLLLEEQDDDFDLDEAYVN